MKSIERENNYNKKGLCMSGFSGAVSKVTPTKKNVGTCFGVFL